jgi:hypothetical protein
MPKDLAQLRPSIMRGLRVSFQTGGWLRFVVVTVTLCSLTPAFQRKLVPASSGSKDKRR